MRVIGLTSYLGIGVIALLQTSNVWAKSVGDYEVKVNVSNEYGGGFNDFVTALNGWSCSSSTNASFSETLRDNHGVEKTTERNAKGNFNMFTDADVDLKFQRDMDAPNPAVGIQVSENCSKTVHHYYQKCSTTCLSKNKSGTCTSSTQSCHQADDPTTKYAYMNWDCSMGVEPDQEGQSQHSECKPAGENFSSFNLGSMIMGMLKAKKVTADLTLDKKHDDYVRNYCSPDDTNRVVVQLTQGVAGNSFQSDLVISSSTSMSKGMLSISKIKTAFSTTKSASAARETRSLSVQLQPQRTRSFRTPSILPTIRAAAQFRSDAKAPITGVRFI
jgi:hypothetical protein